MVFSREWAIHVLGRPRSTQDTHVSLLLHMGEAGPEHLNSVQLRSSITS